MRWFWIALLATASCGGSESDKSSFAGSNNEFNNFNNGSSNTNNGPPVIPDPPEVERFLVRQVAATDTYVFVPNADPESSSLARVDARDLSVTPIRVGLGPTDVVATDVDDVGAVAFVLCEGNNTVAVVRADAPSRDGLKRGDVRLLDVPNELNRLTATPRGDTAIVWIDPTRNLDTNSVASLQVLSLVKLGDEPGNDRVIDLSVTRLIRDVEFTDTNEAFLLGREGVNRIDVDAIEEDTFIPKLDLGLDDVLFDPETLEMEVAPDASFLVIRSPNRAEVALYDLNQDEFTPTIVTLPNTPSDIDLVETATGFLVAATSTNPDTLSLIDPAAAFLDPAYTPENISFDEQVGLTQLVPDQTHALSYSTIVGLPTLQYVNLETLEQQSWTLRNRIASVAVSPDSKTAIVVHSPGISQEEGPDAVFQNSEGLTLVDLETGFRRPIVLKGKPIDLVLTETDDGSVMYALLQSSIDDGRGVVRIDLRSFRSDFVSLPKQPKQIGRVGDQVFISQESSEGRITFLDLITQEQRTVAGYELNAIID